MSNSNGVITQHAAPDLEGEYIATKVDMSDLPSHWDRAVYKVQRGFMGAEWSASMLDWLRRNQHLFVEGGDGERRRNWEIGDMCDHRSPAQTLKDKLIAAAPTAFARCQVKPFDIDWLEMHAIVHHNKDVFEWHTDHFESSGIERAETRTLTFCYYLQQKPRAFIGGELEFWDGTRIDCAHDQLVWINPYQVHRVRRVAVPESNRFLDGRISLIGWLHCKEGEEENNDH